MKVSRKGFRSMHLSTPDHCCRYKILSALNLEEIKLSQSLKQHTVIFDVNLILATMDSEDVSVPQRSPGPRSPGAGKGGECNTAGNGPGSGSSLDCT